MALKVLALLYQPYISLYLYATPLSIFQFKKKLLTPYVFSFWEVFVTERECARSQTLGIKFQNEVCESGVVYECGDTLNYMYW